MACFSSFTSETCNRLSPFPFCTPDANPGAASSHGPIRPVVRRLVRHTQHRVTIVRQADIHAVDRQPVAVVGRSVQRVHDPHPLRVRKALAGLFGNDPVRGIRRPQMREDEPLGRHVGLGHDIEMAQLCADRLRVRPRSRMPSTMSPARCASSIAKSKCALSCALYAMLSQSQPHQIPRTCPRIVRPKQPQHLLNRRPVANRRLSGTAAEAQGSRRAKAANSRSGT